MGRWDGGTAEAGSGGRVTPYTVNPAPIVTKSNRKTRQNPRLQVMERAQIAPYRLCFRFCHPRSLVRPGPGCAGHLRLNAASTPPARRPPPARPRAVACVRAAPSRPAPPPHLVIDQPDGPIPVDEDVLGVPVVLAGEQVEDGGVDGLRGGPDVGSYLALKWRCHR